MGLARMVKSSSLWEMLDVDAALDVAASVLAVLLQIDSAATEDSRTMVALAEVLAS